MKKDKKVGPLPEPGSLPEESWYTALVSAKMQHNLEDDMTIEEVLNFLGRCITDHKLDICSNV